MPDEEGVRQTSRFSLQGRNCDLLIIGGGIVGAGVAREAASRGLETILVEQGDFASGTSSRSSRLLHGGLRYLAQGRVGLVRESSLEKMRLSQIAPHLCQPLGFLFPVWRGSGWSLWPLAIGVKVYDLLCGGRNLGKSSSLGARDLLQLLPGLNPDKLLGGTRHFDAFTNDARLVIDTLRSSVVQGAVIRNYTRFEAASRTGSGWQCVVQDGLNGESARVEARVLVNAAGAWGAGFPHSGIKLRLTKGVHLVIDRQRLPTSEAVVLTAGDRILFVIPWGERTILGTTDTDYSGDPGAVHAAPEDLAYILRIVNTAFPQAKLTSRDVISTWAGVRPLIAPKVTQSGAPSDISRSHVIRMSEPGWFDVAGGKLTTYRHMAEQTVDAVGQYLRQPLPASMTAREPLLAGPFSHVLPPPLERGVIREACHKEWSVHLDDVLLRRTSWHYYWGTRPELTKQVAEWMADELHWDAGRQQQELARYNQVVNAVP